MPVGLIFMQSERVKGAYLSQRALVPLWITLMQRPLMHTSMFACRMQGAEGGPGREA